LPLLGLRNTTPRPPAAMSTSTPSVADFAAHVREAFGYLVSDYGFAEVELSAAQSQQPFHVLYENATTTVLVEGQSWGTSATAYVGPKGARPGHDFALVPLWAIARLGNPVDEREFGAGGQLAQVSANAASLKRLAEPALRGEFTMVRAAQAYLRERMRTSSRN